MTNIRVLICMSLLLIFGAISVRSNPLTNGVAEALRSFARLPTNGVVSGQFSSHSSHQQNGDANNFMYRDEFGDAVIFDLRSPGCLRSMWGTVFDTASVMKFYFDGEKSPRYQIKTVDFYKGKLSGFAPPLVTYDRRGYYLEDAFAGNCYAPVPFSKSLKISMSGDVAFYHFLYDKYPYGTDIKEIPTSGYVSQTLTENGVNPWDSSPADSYKIETATLASWQRVDLLSHSGAGAVRLIEIEADASDDLFKSVYIQMIWDNAPVTEVDDKKVRLAYEKSDQSRLFSVMSPIGMFFASPHNVLNVEAMPLAIKRLDGGRVRLSCYFVMPFWRNAQISLVNKSGSTFGPITSKIELEKTPYPQESTGYFMTHYRKGITEYGKDWIFCDVHGAGKFLGVVQSCRTEHYCEGNEHFYIDGNRTPQINGTGTEDYYLACLWPNIRYNTPFAGCVADVRILGGGDPNAALVCLPTDYTTAAVYYRFHMEMPIIFYSGIKAMIQHGSESQIESEYASLAYLYLRRTPSLRQTDFIKVGNPASMKLHSYRTKGGVERIERGAKYEGDDLYTKIVDNGVLHREGEISFRVAIDKNGSGVRIRRRSDQSVPCQMAEVYVNGKYAGSWYDPQCNDVLSWYDSEFEIDSDHTLGREYLDIKLVVKSAFFTDFEYNIFSYNSYE